MVLKLENEVNICVIRQKRLKVSAHTTFICRDGVLEDVIGLEDTFSSPWPWSRSLKSLKIALFSARGQHYFLNVKNFTYRLKNVFLDRFFGDRPKKNF